MNEKYEILWKMSLFVLAVITVVWAVCRIGGIQLPDMATRIMGMAELIALPILVYTSVKTKK